MKNKLFAYCYFTSGFVPTWYISLRGQLVAVDADSRESALQILRERIEG